MGFPFSKVIIRAKSSIFSKINSCHFLIIIDLSFPVSFFQALQELLAASIALIVSDLEQFGIEPTTVRSEGLKTSKVLPLSELTHSPSIKHFCLNKF